MPNDADSSSARSGNIIVELLNKQLADTIDLRSQVRQAEFNVISPYAAELKGLFDGLANELQRIADLIARPIRDSGGMANGTVRLVAMGTKLPEYPPDVLDDRDHLRALLSSHSRFALDTRQNLKLAQETGESDASNILEVVLASIENGIWFLEAYLEGITVGNRAESLPRWISAFDKPTCNNKDLSST